MAVYSIFNQIVENIVELNNGQQRSGNANRNHTTKKVQENTTAR